MQADVQPGVATYTYSRNEGDFHAENIRIGNGEIFIDFVAPDTRINDIQLGVPVSINIENGVAAMALAHLSGATDEEIKQGMASFRGVDRRFDFKLKNDRIVISQRLCPPPGGNSPKREVRPRAVPRQEDNRHLPASLVHPHPRLLP